MFVLVTLIIIFVWWGVGWVGVWWCSYCMAVGCFVEVLDKLFSSIFIVDPELKTGMENTLAPWKC
jgi:hypothetical protein